MTLTSLIANRNQPPFTHILMAHNDRKKRKTVPISALKSETSRRLCRTFKARATGVVQRATSIVNSLTGGRREEFRARKGWTCAQLLKNIKRYLSEGESSFDSMEGVMAFQSIKKLLPPSCSCLKSGLLADLQARLESPPKALPDGYLSFVRSSVRRLFPKGWDGNYSRKVSVASPNLSSCTEAGRGAGGSQGWWSENFTIDEFRQLCLTGVTGDSDRPFRVSSLDTQAEMLVVDSAGKPRPLTKFSAGSFVLEPLHATVYDRLSRQKWLLRGDVTKEALRRAGFVDGSWGTLVSGDYASATDNLPIEVAEAILESLGSTASCVPAEIMDFAIRSLRPTVSYDGISFQPKVGQMMGSYLSFPLLCIQNFLAFQWSKKVMDYREATPLLINGDDILFQASRDLYDRWSSTVGALGLQVEVTKTSVSRSYGTLNSTLLRWQSGGLCPVPTIRMGILGPSELPHHTGDNLRSFLRGVNKKHWFTATCFFLKWKERERASACCTWGAIGLRGRMVVRAMRSLGVWEREVDMALAGLDTISREPSPHNIILASNSVVVVRKEEAVHYREIQGEEMAEKKWSLAKDFKANTEKRNFLRNNRLRVTERLEALPEYFRFGLSSWTRQEEELYVFSRLMRPVYTSDVCPILKSVYDRVNGKAEAEAEFFNLPPAYYLAEEDVAWEVDQLPPPYE